MFSNNINTNSSFFDIDDGVYYKICIHSIVEYFSGTVRPLREGENLVDAGWIYLLGIAPLPAKDKILGYVIQTSEMAKKPHEVQLNYISSSNTSKWICLCSCKAGIGQKCKHIAACLIFILRNPKLHALSCTELKQSWGKAGRDIVSKYNGVKIQNMCHVERKIVSNPQEELSEDIKQLLLEKLLKGAPNSELSRMKSSYRSQQIPENVQQNNEFFVMLFENQNEGLKKFVPLMEKYVEADEIIKRKFECKIKKNLDEIISVCENTISQTSAQWLTERKLRITGSVSYNLYTYSNNKTPDWTKKIKSIYSSNFKGNDATRYGIYAEKKAKIKYGQIYLLFECGLFISPTLPYLACSPDGISYNGCEWKLVEIKCPVLGKELGIRNILPKLKFIQKCGDHYILNKRHKYYGQVQLSLGLCNLNYCDFVIYSLFENNFVIIDVPRDKEFIDKFIRKLTKIYFKYIIKMIVN